jgi:hypothetical protein
MFLDRNRMRAFTAPVLFGGSAFFLVGEIRSAEPAESWFGETGRIRLKVTNVATSPILREALKTKALPLTFASILLTLVFMPVACSIGVRSVRAFSTFGLTAAQYYDPVQASFFLVILASATFALHTIAISCKLAALLRRLESKK